MTTVLLTDRAWPDTRVEREVLESAGLRLVAGPPDPADAATIEALVAEHQPAAILTCWASVSANAIASSAALRVVARMGVGLDNIDLAEATRRGVWVTNVPDYCVEEVSDHAIALVLAWTRGLVASDREVSGGTMESGRRVPAPTLVSHLRRGRIRPNRSQDRREAARAGRPGHGEYSLAPVRLRRRAGRQPRRTPRRQ